MRVHTEKIRFRNGKPNFLCDSGFFKSRSASPYVPLNEM